MVDIVLYKHYMGMVERIYLQNFQSHKDTDIEFMPGVNVIVGSTDSGKSAIIRALKMAMLNKPSGDAMRSHWGGETSVLIEFDDAVVERVKSTAEIYRLNEDEFRAFRTVVPDEVAAAVNMNDQNFQNQLDAPFLLSSTAGEVASFFNSIANIDKIDISLRRVQSWLNKLNAKFEHEEAQLVKVNKGVSEFDFITAVEKEIVVLEEMLSRVRQLAKQAKELSTLCLYVDTLLVSRELLEDLLQLSDEVDLYLGMYAEVKVMQAELDNLQKLITTAQTIQKLITQKSLVVKAEKPLERVLVWVEKRNDVKTEESAITQQITTAAALEGEIEKLDLAISKDVELFEINFPEMCPLCGSPKHKNIDDYEEEQY